MKVLIIGFTKIKYMPYLQFYVDIYKKANFNIDIFYWNRDNSKDINLDPSIELIPFNMMMEDEIPLYKKIYGFLQFRKRLKPILSKKYDRVVVLHTLPGLLVLDVLISKYKKKYILDYRDFTFENNFLFKKLIHILCKNAFFTLISSPVYRKFLPKNIDLYDSFNLVYKELSCYKISNKIDFNKKIKIAYFGFIRDYDINLKIINLIRNEDRFVLNYYGREQKTAIKLKNYVKKESINNVFFNGPFQPQEKYIILNKTDIIHNFFENNKTMVSAISNRFYDSIFSHKVQLVNDGSYMGLILKKNGLGFVQKLNQNYFENLYNFLHSTINKDLYLSFNIEKNEIIKKYTFLLDKIVEKEKKYEVFK
jgi:hypothetical protein